MVPPSHPHDGSACDRPDLAEKLVADVTLDASERAELELHLDA